MNTAVLSLSVILLGTVSASGSHPSSIPPSPVPQPQKILPKILAITWSRGPDLPQGLQDDAVAQVGDMLISIGGFCSGQRDVPGKPDKYPRGFLANVWATCMSCPCLGWQTLPDFPGHARQAIMAVAVNNQVYTWGGFSYTAPYSYRDGYRLYYENRRWRWEKLPKLPWPLNTAGVCSLGSRIYFFGGADYDGQAFLTAADRTGKVPRIGARLLTIDVNNLAAGWQELEPCPGTPRFVHATAAVRGKIYVLGGASGGSTYCTVVDNWCYDPQTGQWQRIRDLPVASGNFPDGKIVFRERYILLIGGYQYGKIMNPDGTTRSVYGKPYSLYPEKGLYSDIFVYDTETDLFGIADPLPLTNNVPITLLQGDRVHLLGGECGNAVIEGEHYGHHPDLYLIGKIRLLQSASCPRAVAELSSVLAWISLRR